MIAAGWIVAVPETLAVPLNDALVQLMSPVAAIVLPVANCVADEALPDNAALIVPALKLPEASRATMVDGVFADVAVVAELGMLVEAVKAPVPLPYTYPVRVVAPVPPAATGKVPAVKVVAPVEYSALLAPVNVVRPVPP